MYAEFDLQKIKTRLPPPLDRPKGMLNEKLVIQTEADSADAHILAVRAGKHVAGRLIFETGHDTWRFSKGWIGFGVSTIDTPRADGLHLAASVGTFDGDKWLALARGDGPRGLPEVITRVSAYFRSLDLFERKFERFALDFDRRGRAWHGNLRSPAVAGRIRYEPGSPAGQIDLDLEKLHWPQRHRRGADVEIDPRRLPNLALRVQSLQVRERPLGAFSVEAEHMPWGWKISKVGLTRPEMRLAADGTWRYRLGRHASQFDLAFSSEDLGETMAAWGLPDQVDGGKVSVKSQLSWNGSPASPSYAGLNGRVEVSARKGRFVQVKQGAGRLFGIFDISSIFRMVVLDFSALFGKGYPYDKISGTISLEQGDAYTRDLSVRGPIATLNINGRVGLAQEDFDLVLSVAPELSGSVTSASWLILGPTTAVIVAALQKLFKKQIKAGTRVLYVVKGTWEEPTITRVANEEARSPESN